MKVSERGFQIGKCVTERDLQVSGFGISTFVGSTYVAVQLALRPPDVSNYRL